MLSRRVKLGLVAATATVSTLGGVGIAHAAPGHITQPQTTPTSYLGGHAPDGTRITGLSVNPGHSWADGVAPAAAVEGQAANAVNIPVSTTGGVTLAKDLLTRPANGGAQPPAPGNTGEMSVKGGYQWFPGSPGGSSGVRLRASAPSGTTLAYLPRYGRVWLWCELKAGGSWWYRTALNTSRGWLYGYTSQQYVSPQPDRAIPHC